MIYDAHAHHKSDQCQITLSSDAFAVHPWDLKENLDFNEFSKHWHELTKNLAPVICIGECGVDRHKAGIASVETQKLVFKLHLELAQKLAVPTIIHCVKAYSDIIEILKIVKPTSGLLFHDFNGQEEQVKILMEFNSYFSFGRSLFRENEAIKNKIKSIPRDRLLLETGDQTTTTIGEIYQKASEILGISPQNLEEQLEKNFSNFLNLNDISPANFIKNFHKTKRL